MSDYIQTKPIVFFDLETTSVNTEEARIVEIAMIKFEGNLPAIEKHTLINPGIPIPEEATAVHGIKNEDVTNKPLFSQLSKGILAFIDGCDLCGFNSNSYDIPILYREFLRAGIEWDYSAVKFYDACVIFKRQEPRDLASAMKHYFNEELTGAHSALIDTKATMKVFAEQLRRYKIEDIELYSNYDEKRADIDGWFKFDGEKYILARGKSKGTQDAGFINWMLKNLKLMPDTKNICDAILRKG